MYAATKDLTKLLSPYSATKLYHWRPLLVVTGARFASQPVAPDDLLGFLLDEPLRLKTPQEAQRAIRLTRRLSKLVSAALESGQALAASIRPPQHLNQFARQLADGLFGFADGLDVADIDPDALSGQAATAFEALARRAAALEQLATELPDRDDPDVRRELLALLDATDDDIRQLFLAIQTTLFH